MGGSRSAVVLKRTQAWNGVSMIFARVEKAARTFGGIASGGITAKVIAEGSDYPVGVIENAFPRPANVKNAISDLDCRGATACHIVVDDARITTRLVGNCIAGECAVGDLCRCYTRSRSV